VIVRPVREGFSPKEPLRGRPEGCLTSPPGRSMKKAKMRTFRSRLREDLKDPEFKTHYQEERQALKLAMKIAKLREKKGLSQQQMAKLMGTSQQAISRIESGEYEGFTLKTLEKIAEATGTKVKIEFVAA